MTIPALLVLGDGTIFKGTSIGAKGQSVGEVVFNTAMTGYQEILTDPSYARQIVTLTYPHVGNVGTNPEDDESRKSFVSGLVIRDLPLLASSFRNKECLSDFLNRHQVVGIADLDTRKLTRILREKGAQAGCIVSGDDIDEEAALLAAREFPGLQGMDLARYVSIESGYSWKQGCWNLVSGLTPESDDTTLDYHVIAYDFGVKYNILRMLVTRGCKVTVVPAQTPATDVLALNPDGIFLSNGPGDPEPCDYAIDAIKTLLATDKPIFGICLGHQLLGIACGASCYKMDFGHHGANHPVQDLSTGKVMITSQNHGFALDEDTLPTNVEATHRSLFDGSLQGIQVKGKPAFGFQGHPEASPGPHDVAYLFDQFVSLMANSNA